MPRMTKDQAQEILHRIGCSAAPDFFTLPIEQVAQVLWEADLVKYRRPQNANGSRARYFYGYLTRTARKKD